MEAATQSLKRPWTTDLVNTWTDFVRLRREMLAEVQAAGPACLSPNAFESFWLDRLHPWHVVATPGGDAEENDAPMLFGTFFKEPPPGFERVIPRFVAWGRLHKSSLGGAGAGFSLRDHDAWFRMIQANAPCARLMLNGRRHRLMVPRELEDPIQEIINMGISVKIDPFFEPEDRDLEARAAEAKELAGWSNRTTFRCDITGKEIAAADALVLTPWEFRRSPLRSLFEKKAAAKFLADLQLLTDWSDWIVQRHLLEESRNPWAIPFAFIRDGFSRLLGRTVL
jgi:hypothetical protein